MNKKTILLTGADGGLGRTVTALLLEKGYHIIASAFNAKSIETLTELFPEKMGKELTAKLCDLSNEEDIKRLIGYDASIYGLVHLAGGYAPGNSISDYTFDDYNKLMNLNVLPTFLLLKTIFPILKENGGGAMVTIGAKPALIQTKGNSLYAASKSAVITLTLSTAEEGRAYSITSNCIAPETLQTPNNLSWATPEQFKNFTPTAAVADVIAFLMSEEGKAVNGMVIPMYNTTIK